MHALINTVHLNRQLCEYASVSQQANSAAVIWQMFRIPKKNHIHCRTGCQNHGIHNSRQELDQIEAI